MQPQVCITKDLCVNAYFVIAILIMVIVYMTQIQKDTQEIVSKAYAETDNLIKSEYPQDQHPELYRRLQDQLEEPSRTYQPTSQTYIPPGAIPVNQSTQGGEPSYQAVGYVYRDETDPAYNPDQVNTFQLYGRPTYYGSNIWEYYVIIQNNVKIVLDNTKEIEDGDKVTIRGYAGEWNVTIYEDKTIKYIPYVY